MPNIRNIILIQLNIYKFNKNSLPEISTTNNKQFVLLNIQKSHLDLN